MGKRQKLGIIDRYKKGYGFENGWEKQRSSKRSSERQRERQGEPPAK